MPKLSIEWTDEEYYELEDRLKYGLHGKDFWCVLWGLDQELRNMLKWSDEKFMFENQEVKDIESLVEKIREYINEDGLLDRIK